MKIDPRVLADLDGEQIHYDALPENAILSRKYLYLALTAEEPVAVQDALAKGVNFLQTPQGWDFWKDQFDEGRLSSDGRAILDATL